ncbi:PREDICTED: uncharacterized protein LOC103328503 isoform X1 [Prunus mume]|uniref:Uncharacterized protein LOC103328503 isoform X1 n=1 Tax=Prunus mume TaxID=102107 RepID=A0ABM0NSD4_PRUMU|nr:PREDICTED: uncharacterized protein LOC103328503 isoform X1 [Prunus mume]
MMLKNLMEEKQLNFNQPLLSVRRFSATVVSSEADEKRKTEKSLPKLPPLPVYKSELKSGPVRNPGTVPFVWEQIPGRPKDERKSPNRALEWLPTAPKLPPGRVSKVKKQATDKGSKCTTAAQSPTGNVPSNSQNVSTLDTKEATKYDSSKVEMEDKGIAGSDDGDETYLDALSRSESFFMNCSVSGLSGLDGLDIKPSGTFSTDPQTRDFMMGRFLPAAKAMASETPQYASRKQPVAREQPLLQEQPSGMKKVVSGDKQHPLNQHRPKDLPHYVQDIAGDKNEDEGMRVQAQLPISSVRRVRAKSSYAISYREAKKEHSGGDSCEKRLMSGHPEARVPEDKNDLIHESNQITNRIDCQKLDGSPMYRRLQGSGISPYRNECAQHEQKCFLGIPEKAKNYREAISSGKYRKCHNNFQELLAAENVAELEMGPGSPVVEKTLYIDSVQTVKSPNSKSCSSDAKGRIIDYRGNGFEICEKSDKVEEITHSVESSFQDTEHLGDGNEKAIVRHKSLEFPDSSFLSSSGRSSDDVQTDIRIGYIPNQDLIQHFSKVTSSKGADQEKLNLESKQLVKSGDRENFVGLTPICTTLTSTKLAGEKKIGLESQQSRQSSREDSSHGHVQNSVALTSSEVTNKGKIDLESHRLVKLGNQESPRGNKVPLPLGPPLPKSPSESWLKRTLPSISSRSSSSQSSLGSRSYTSSQASKTSSLDPKWETIVKTSKPHHGHLRFSEVVLNSKPSWL